MDSWKIYAIAAAVFAGLTAVIAKAGMNHLHADVALSFRTLIVSVLVVLHTAAWQGIAKPVAALRDAGWKSLSLLALSAIATTLSWVCYYRALKEGSASVVSLIDKGSILVTLFFAVILLGEPFSWRVGCGGGLVLAGLLLLAGGK